MPQRLWKRTRKAAGRPASAGSGVVWTVLFLVLAGCAAGLKDGREQLSGALALVGEASLYRDPDAPPLAYNAEGSYDTRKFLRETCLSGRPPAYCAVLDGPFKPPVGELEGFAQTQYLRGHSLFNANWSPAPSRLGAARDGLGPVYDATGCARCHVQNGRGRPTARDRAAPRTLILRLSLGESGLEDPPPPHPRYGDQLNTRAIAGVPAEGRLEITYEEIEGRFPDGETYRLRKPRHRVVNPAHGPLEPEARISPRLPPPVTGLGLVEALPEAVLLARADPEDSDGDGISGRANFVHDPEDGRLVLGRYGWKAGTASLRQQTAGALLGDMGITSPLFPEANCTAAQEACRAQPEGGQPEIGEADLAALVFYMQILGPPGRRNSADPEVVRGAELFEAAGCAACHVTEMTSAEHPDTGILSNLVFYPYSDFLLHDMGPGLADGRAEYAANGREWRTPPLWGAGLAEALNGHGFYLHDGRALTLQEAILWHGGEAEAARRTFTEMSKVERTALLRFLESL